MGGNVFLIEEDITSDDACADALENRRKPAVLAGVKLPVANVTALARCRWASCCNAPAWRR